MAASRRAPRRGLDPSAAEAQAELFVIPSACDANVAGVDEAGRGPLAGAVFAAAVILDAARPIIGLADSKALTAARREVLATEIRAYALAWAVASASVQEIDRLNILQATLLAMKRAVESLPVCAELALVDGNQPPPPHLPAPQAAAPARA